MKILLFIWQLPQHLLALAIWLVLKKRIVLVEKFTENTFILVNVGMGLSLGRYIFMHHEYNKNIRKHEQGHTIQSKMLGPLYLLVIGLPSLSGNTYNRIKKKGSKWYYSQPWESWADRLGGVQRGLMEI